MSGRPTGLSTSSLRTTMEAATRMVNSERLNRKRPAEDGEDESIADPGEDDSWNGATSQQMEIWKLLPHLQGLPEAMLRKLPLNAVFQLNSALAKDQKTTAKMISMQEINWNFKRKRNMLLKYSRASKCDVSLPMFCVSSQTVLVYQRSTHIYQCSTHIYQSSTHIYQCSTQIYQAVLILIKAVLISIKQYSY